MKTTLKTIYLIIFCSTFGMIISCNQQPKSTNNEKSKSNKVDNDTIKSFINCATINVKVVNEKGVNLKDWKGNWHAIGGQIDSGGDKMPANGVLTWSMHTTHGVPVEFMVISKDYASGYTCEVEKDMNIVFVVQSCN